MKLMTCETHQVYELTDEDVVSNDFILPRLMEWSVSFLVPNFCVFILISCKAVCGSSFSVYFHQNIAIYLLLY